MKATRILKDLGQSLWLDNITRNLLKTGGLRRYIDEFDIYSGSTPARNFEIGSRSADDLLGNRVVALPLPVVGRLTQFQQGVGFLLLLALHVNEVRPPHALLHAIVAGSKEVPCLGSPVR